MKGDDAGFDATSSSRSDATLDVLFRASAAKTPNALALIDPPDIEAVTGKAPQNLTFAQADERIGALARLLREIGIPEGGTVAIQLPNNADSVIALLAVARAGLVPALLPLLWRRAECAAALSRAHAKAILCCGSVGDFDHGQLALEIAAEVFPIRAVCGFGPGLADGIVPIEIATASIASAGAPDFFPDTAAITFDTDADGPLPVEREAVKLLATGLLIGRLAGITRGARLLSTIPISSYAGMSAALIPWLVSGGTLAFHHPFSPDLLSRQIEASDIVVVPDAVAARLSVGGKFGSHLHSVISLCRSPERFASGPTWQQPELPLVDVAAFGEMALLAVQRPTDGDPAPWPRHVRSADGDSEIAQAFVTPTGTLGISGTLAAKSATWPESDTGYPCRMDQDGIVVTAAPAGFVNVGGYRFAMRDLQHAIRTIEGGGLLAPLPHSLTGHRLAGHAADPQTMRQTLKEFGLGPLVTGAFRDPPPLV
ncbi:MAG: class I adenylate-forming enzyme family protein [Pseudorhodoplanes sp.]